MSEVTLILGIMHGPVLEKPGYLFPAHGSPTDPPGGTGAQATVENNPKPNFAESLHPKPGKYVLFETNRGTWVKFVVSQSGPTAS